MLSLSKGMFTLTKHDEVDYTPTRQAGAIGPFPSYDAAAMRSELGAVLVEWFEEARPSEDVAALQSQLPLIEIALEARVRSVLDLWRNRSE